MPPLGAEHDVRAATSSGATAVYLRRPLRPDERPSTQRHFRVGPAPAPVDQLIRGGVGGPEDALLQQWLRDGELLVRVIYVSVDPYHFQYALRQPLVQLPARAHGHTPPQQQPVMSRGVGIVEQSRSASYAVGTYVFGSFGWTTHCVVKAGAAAEVAMADGSSRSVGGSDSLRTIELPPSPPPDHNHHRRRSPLPRYLGVLGMPGLAAYAGVERILRPQRGSQVLISSAAGAVGLVAGQVAKLRGARVVGSTSSDRKCRFLREQCGFDEAFNYTAAAPTGTEPELSAALAKHFPAGIDCYFDNVGGAMLDAVLGLANAHARVAVCGLISTLPAADSASAADSSAAEDDAAAAGTTGADHHTWQFRNFSSVLTKQLQIQGFQARVSAAVSGFSRFTLTGICPCDPCSRHEIKKTRTQEHFDLFDEYVRRMNAWLDDGKVTYAENILGGIEAVPDALVSMLAGSNVGKQLVQVSADPWLQSPPGGRAKI
jgi:NADPH-dependent curcumin reductase CurA